MAVRRDELDDPFDGVRHQDLKFLDRGVQSPRLEFCEDEFGDLAAAGAAGVVRLIGDRSHVFPQVRRRRYGLKPPLALTLINRVPGRKAAKSRCGPGSWP